MLIDCSDVEEIIIDELCMSSEGNIVIVIYLL
jgi:hypothetical protein